MKTSVLVIGLIGLLIFVSGGIDKSPGPQPARPKRVEAPEYNCLHHAADNICEVPVNGKVVLYCVKGVKRVVHYREDCK